MANNKEAAADPTLDALWRNTPDAGPPPTCFVCGGAIRGPKQPLVRTFALQSLVGKADSDEDKVSKGNAAVPSRAIAVPEQNDTILLYDRHAKCLGGVAYVTVSHVWNAKVADVQYRRHQRGSTCSAEEVEEARKLAYALPVAVYRGIVTARRKKEEDDSEQPLELWHDYVSVPQWQDNQKRKILLEIPQIYAGARYTVVYLEDVDAQALKLMREGESSLERLTGVVRVCNAAWFSRVWTAMEFVQSAALRVMLSDGTLDDAGGNAFLGELQRTFANEVREHGDGHKVEAIVDRIGAGRNRKNLVPWMLGQLCQVRNDLKRGGSTEFALAFSLLSRRRLTHARDFFYALLGVVPADVEPEELRNDPQRACLQIAKACMNRGDYSPLLMIPAWVRESGHPQIEHGFNDVNTWGLNQLAAPADKDGIAVRGDKAWLKCVEIGTVHFLRRFRYGALAEKDPSDILSFSHIARLALDFTGPDIEAFVETVGGRLYGQKPRAIFDRLAREDRYQHLKHLLTQRYNAPLEDPWAMRNARWIAEAMGLSTTDLKANPRLAPLKFVRHHGGTMHMGGSAAIVGIACPACHGRFLYRVAPYKLLSDTLGAVAYRIPGLKYGQTHKDGVAILVKDGRIIGRMVWATPACSCNEPREIEVELEKLPVPAPNDYKYGTRE